MENMEDSGRTSEEWEEWMDWEKTTDVSGKTKGPLENEPSTNEVYQLPSPEASTTSDTTPNASRKRKISAQDQGMSRSETPKKQGCASTITANKSHSIVEKRYRTNLNQKIAELGECLPSLRDDDKTKEDDAEATKILKHNKATILTEGIAYIKYLERRNAYLEQAQVANDEEAKEKRIENVFVTEQQQVFQKPGSLEGTPVSPAASSPSPTESSNTTPAKPIQGMIKVPEEWRRLWRGELSSYSPEPKTVVSENQSSGNVKIRGGRYAGKIMLGSLGGLMVMDGLASTQKDKTDDRGLFALPLIRHLPKHTQIPFASDISFIWSDLMALPYLHLVAPFLKAGLIFCILGLLLFIYLFTSRPPPRKQCSTPTPQPAPSLASPLEVRQRAFLTAIQTIWVPSHHVLPEMLALNVETAAYLVRQLLGWQTYSWLTGRNEDQEIARVRAWDIAIDAQLCGGDPEISKSRLVLSLWASGTLPNSPGRLMLKALHIRILFWEPSRWPWITDLLHKAARQLAHWQWNKACRLQKKLEQADQRNDSEPLTDHLKTLLSRPSSEVTTDAMIQRTHSLAWNTTTLSPGHSENTAMRGPLDGLASFYSETKLTAVLHSVIEKDQLVWDQGDHLHLEMADRSAPRGSAGKLKALAAKALLSGTARSEHFRLFLGELTRLPTAEGRGMEDLVSRANSMLGEMPPNDSGDLVLCMKCIPVMTRLLEAEETNQSCTDISQTSNSFNIEAATPGLLGWTALCLSASLFLQASGLSPDCKRAIKPTLEYCASMTRDAKNLDTRSQDLVARSFERMLDHKIMRRRRSGASDDTGYGSMSEEEVPCSRGER